MYCCLVKSGLRVRYSFTEPETAAFQTIQDADVTEDTITIRWNAPASGADTYELTYEITSQGSNSGNTFTGLTSTCKCSYLVLSLDFQMSELDSIGSDFECKCNIFLKAMEVTGLSAGEDYTFKLIVVKHGERSGEVSTNSNTSK